ncbi:SDR family oxidoreductase [Sinomicrobium weinanense]|uniref:SDR family oxidoreductase n=1 Tax=Sinomicrobium weinanense TaxID=2842200 RepID=A0A926JV46_9FLAO|nr:SDR family oxidoreductase [Sinomicrobium weinanense]MBC9797772.1 SDR family oxidoreductase [Sinomicrobium weinanense]MBU3122409.1 SDR family oxidoreductase [Sinomicrobium weinanense]
MDTKKVWFVTGASKGLGLALVKRLLAENHYVAATSRTVVALKQKISDVSDVFLPLEMDITNDREVKEAVEKVTAHFGQIDVVVNNAGYGQTGTVEELLDREVKQNFDVNVFGVANVIRYTAAHLRRQRSGHIFNISSVGGFVGSFPGFGVYCSTKFALAGLTEALAEEMKPFNIRTTLVYPGYFRTDFLTSGSIKTPEAPIDAYTEARRAEQVHFNEIDGNQPNDPEKAAGVILQLSESDNPPVHFFMGEDACQFAQQKIATLQRALDENKILSCSTGFKN